VEHVYPSLDPCNPHPDSDYVWLSGLAMPGGFGIPSLCATHWETSADGPESGRVQRCLGPLERSESPFDADNFHTLHGIGGIQFQEIMMWRPESIEWHRLGTTFPFHLLLQQEFCIELTGIQQSWVDNVIWLPEVLPGDTPTKPFLASPPLGGCCWPNLVLQMRNKFWRQWGGWLKGFMPHCSLILTRDS